jgi:UDP-glucuronate decarboxylase
MKRILVTGGAGFLGSHLCDRLLDGGNEVVCLDNFFTGRRTNVHQHFDNPNFELVRHDVCDPLRMEVDEIYHLACPASPIHYQRNPARTLQTTVLGTLNMLELARDVQARILIASTSEVYGDPSVHPQVESYWGNVNPIGPRSCYDEGKRCAESLAVSFAAQYRVQIRIARIFNTYGPRMLENDGRVVSNFIVQCLRDEPITIYGEGKQTRSFCYVDDLITGLVLLMGSECAAPVNLGNPRECTIAELAEAVKTMLRAKTPFVYMGIPGDDPVRRKPDISRAIALGWQPTIDLDEGLRRTIAHFKSRPKRTSVSGPR